MEEKINYILQQNDAIILFLQTILRRQGMSDTELRELNKIVEHHARDLHNEREYLGKYRKEH